MFNQSAETRTAESKLRIALVANWDWVLYNFRLPLARALRDRGCEVLFVCPYGKYVARLEEDGFQWLNWQLDRRSLNPLKELYSIARLAAIYGRERPVLVHHFTIKPNLYGSLAARMARVPFVINTFSGLGLFFSDDARFRIIRFTLGPLMRWVLRGPNIWTIFQNASDYRDLTEHKLVNAHQAQVIGGSGVNVERFYPRNKTEPSKFAESSPSVPTFLMASRLLREKGIAEFVEAARLLKLKGLNSRFWLAGEPDNGNPSSVSRDQLRGWMQEGVVEFLGHSSNMPDLLRHADIAVLPTYYPEGVPFFLLEAAATGLPLVASDIPGCRVVVREEVNGYLVPPKNASALAQALERLLRDETLRSRFGEASRRIALEEFTEEKVLGDYMALYRQLLSFA